MNNSGTKRVHFTGEDNFYLAREVVGNNPFEDTSRLNLIQINLLQITGKNCSIRTLKDRINNLVAKFSVKDKTARIKSGIEEEVNKIDELLRNIADLIKEFKAIKSVQKYPLVNSYAEGYQQREAVASGINEEFIITEDNINVFDTQNFTEPDIEVELQTESGPSTSGTFKRNSVKRPKMKNNIQRPLRARINGSIKQETLDYLSKKSDKFYELRCRELALQERAQTLKEEQFELERRERLQRMETEDKQVAIPMKLIENQQKLIDVMCIQSKNHQM